MCDSRSLLIGAKRDDAPIKATPAPIGPHRVNELTRKHLRQYMMVRYMGNSGAICTGA